MFRILLALSVFVILACPVQAQTGTLTDGNATFTQSSVPTSVGSNTMRASFRPEGGATTNSLYDQWMFYRIGATGRERPFGSYSTTAAGVTNTTAMTSSYVGNVATHTLTDSLSTTGTQLTATWTIGLQDSATPNTALLVHNVTLTNPTAAAITVSLFQYVDIDLADTAGGQSATGGINGMFSTDGTLTGSLVPITPATNFQATAFATLRNSLTNNSTTTLNGTGLPFSPGDVTFAYQWDVTIPAGGSTVISSYMGVQPVPEPGMVLACCLGLAGLGRLYRKRRKAVA